MTISDFNATLPAYLMRRVVGAAFQTLPGASFVNGAAQAHGAALVTASAKMKRLNG
jgi:hypothetical protein